MNDLDLNEKNLFILKNKDNDNDSSVENLPQNSLSIWKKARIKFFKHKPSVFWLIILIILIAMAIIVPLTSPYKINQGDQNLNNAGASASHWFGTNGNGEDTFVRVWFGLGISMLFGLFAALLSFFVGFPIGLIQGYFGGIVDNIILAVEQIISSVPDIILFIVILVAFGRSPYTLVLALSLYMWIGTAYSARANVIQQKNLEYVLVAKTLGTSNFKIIFKHIVPNIMTRQIVIVSSIIPVIINYEAFLSFIGVGVDQNKTVTLGGLLSSTNELLVTNPEQVLFPAAVLILFTVSVNFIAQGLQYALDEKL